jgi:hypothetical protein
MPVRFGGRGKIHVCPYPYFSPGFQPQVPSPTMRRLKGRKIERRDNRNMACRDTIHLPKHWFIFSSLPKVCSFAIRAYHYLSVGQ